jgi:hypothetical protein
MTLMGTLSLFHRRPDVFLNEPSLKYLDIRDLRFQELQSPFSQIRTLELESTGTTSDSVLGWPSF